MKLSRRKLLRYGATALLGGLSAEALTEPNRLEALHQSVEIAGLPKVFEGFRIGMMSDIHWGHNIDSEFVGRAYHLLEAFEPDLIVIPGDFYHGQGQTASSAPNLKGVLERFSAPCGVSGTLGNHDHSIGRAFVEHQIADHSPIRLIDNRGVLLEKSGEAIALGGVGDLWHDVIDLRTAFKDVPPEMPRILLSHNPDIAEEVMGDSVTRVDLQLSGHTHGGQMVVPGVFNPYSFISQYGAKYNRGFVEGRRHRVFVSKGIARLNHLRLFALPDVACITLKGQKMEPLPNH